MVKIRLQKLGRRNRACYRIVVTDARVKRQGLYLEKVGQYDPVMKDETKQLTVDGERVKHWLNLGAQATESVALLLRRAGVVMPKPAKAKKAPRKTAPAAAPAAPAASAAPQA